MKGGSPEVLAVVKDLFFVARIRETARLAGVPLVIARTVHEDETSVDGPRLLLLAPTGGSDYPAFFPRRHRLRQSTGQGLRAAVQLSRLAQDDRRARGRRSVHARGHRRRQEPAVHRVL